ncbi:junctional cadherin 5-associated protein isoform X1 [Manis javanica]|uniref:junctional cadherin 5-associated protein isoform X1 n=1 Tax=Manis javanica TaxID=9974 RepID=UPI003C6CECDD
MYSVEDLLISHGYKLSRNIPARREGNDEGRRQARTGARVSHGLLNGCEEGPAALAPRETCGGEGHTSDPAHSRHAPRVPGEPQGAPACRTSQAGFYHHPVLAWSSQPQTGHSHAYWRRRGQESSGLLGLRAREDPEVRGMAQAHSLPMHTREGPWEVGGRTENVTKKAVWEEELRMSGPARWQNVSLESWNQPRKLGRQMSDGDREKLFQDLYPFMQGEQMLNSQSKGKSQSLPRVLSPESLSCMEVPISLNDGHLPGVPQMPFYPSNCAPNLEPPRNSEKGGSSIPLARPKFGRPLKPPSYGSCQQPRGGAESSDYLDSQQTDLCVSHLSRVHDSRQELCVYDSGLEPPVYVPPPSYRSPPQHVPNPYKEDAMPEQVCGGRHQQQHPVEKAGTSGQLPPGTPWPGNECGVGPRSPHGPPLQSHPTTAYDSSVLYIPFDDPRIRHIKLSHPQGFCEETVDDKPYNSGLVPAPGPAQGNTHQDGAILNPEGMTTPQPGTAGGPASADPSPQWLGGQFPSDGENGGFPDPRDHGVLRGQQPDVRGGRRGLTEAPAPSQSPQGESTCATQPKLKKFETGLQTKKSSKKKMNETIFCLVSIPVKSKSHLPDIDTNNNDLKQSADKRNGLDKKAALQEQSLLSMSSTDLELQALTGSMAGRTEFQKQVGEPGDKQTNDLRLIHLVKHPELTYSDLWPGHQCRDQQTQTSFTEEPRSAQPLPGEKLAGSRNAVLTPGLSDPPASEAQMPVAIASSDPDWRLNAHHLQGQKALSPSSNSAFSRTSSSINQASVPKAQCQPCVDGRVRGASPVPRGEVVKGETTGPCNSKQLFGQFLLKPVSRRPWDLISQLESFNKELQEEEESSESDGGSGDSEAEGPRGGPDSTPRNLGSVEGGQDMRGRGPDPTLWSGRVKSKSESWSEEQKPDHPCARAQPPGPLQAEDSRRGTLLSANGSLIIEKGNQAVEKKIKEPVVSPGPTKRMTSSRLNDTEPMSPSNSAELREPQERQGLPSVFNSVELSKASPPRAGHGEDRSTVATLFLASKPRGLSAPDLRSVGLTLVQEQSASKSHRSLGEASAVEIPPNESLQERAARILGIEVAVESLLPGVRRSGQTQHPEPEGGAGRPQSPREESLSSSAQPDGPAVSTDSFYGRRRCGWTESPLSVGERDSTRWAPPDPERCTVAGAVPSKAPSAQPQPGPQESTSLDHKDMGTRPPFRSTLFHFIEKTPSVAGSEKRLRSTSKVIESLQEKLASPPRRADPHRLMRMKEVSSVSRMRLLSSRSPDSVEEAGEPKAERVSGMQPGGLVPLNAQDPAQKAGFLLSISKGILSLEENGHLAAEREKNTYQDFWCPDSYDPSRVERV